MRSDFIQRAIQVIAESMTNLLANFFFIGCPSNTDPMISPAMAPIIIVTHPVMLVAIRASERRGIEVGIHSNFIDQGPCSVARWPAGGGLKNKSEIFPYCTGRIRRRRTKSRHRRDKPD
jgi:hypothetical protein